MEGMVGNLPYKTHGIRRGDSKTGVDLARKSAKGLYSDRIWSRRQVAVAHMARPNRSQSNRAIWWVIVVVVVVLVFHFSVT